MHWWEGRQSDGNKKGILTPGGGERRSGEKRLGNSLFSEIGSSWGAAVCFIFHTVSLRLADKTNFLHESLDRFSAGFRRIFNIYLASFLKATYAEWWSYSCAQDSCWLLRKSVLLGERASGPTRAQRGGKSVVSSPGPWEYITSSSWAAAELAPSRISPVRSPGLY